MVAFPAGEEMVLYRKNKIKDAIYTKYCVIPSGREGSQRVVFLRPSGKGRKCWEASPQVRLLSLHTKKNRGKFLILMNLSRWTVLHALDGKLREVLPGKVISYTRSNVKKRYRIAAFYGRKKEVLYRTAIKLNPDRGLLILAFYDANPKTNLGRSVGVFRAFITMKETSR